MVEERYAKLNIHSALMDVGMVMKRGGYLSVVLEALGVIAAQLAVLLPEFRSELREIRNTFYELSHKQHCRELKEADRKEDEEE